jgi:hypothetical protein
VTFRTGIPAPNFGHLRAITDPLGIWEHSRFSSPRRDLGFCTDDNARALVVVCNQAASDSNLADLAAIYLNFVLEARIATGGFHNRRGSDGVWLDEVGSDDSQGRAWWALGTVTRHGYEPWMRRAGKAAFADCDGFGSSHLRPNAFAALGAVEFLAAEPKNEGAQRLLARTSQILIDAARSRIPWPEIRLTYDNARIPEALMAAGAALGDERMIDTGIRLLERLLWVETDGDHFSFTPVGGWERGETRPGYDQQPLEAAAMAGACHRAWTMTGNPLWRAKALRSAHWLLGRNDTGVELYDIETGATCDGLQQKSVNRNQGAESTVAGLAVLQVASLFVKNSQETARPSGALELVGPR